MDKIKDFFHNFSDIFFAIAVAGVMAVVLSLNLGSLFNNTSDTVLADQPVHVIENNDDYIVVENDNQQNDLESKEDSNTKDNETKEAATEEPKDVQVDNNVDTKKNEVTTENPAITPQIKIIVIPNGTPGSGVAKILKENGLIEDPSEFIKTAENLNLAIRLKSGSFEIPTNSTIEDMVKIIAGQKR